MLSIYHLLCTKRNSHSQPRMLPIPEAAPGFSLTLEQWVWRPPHPVCLGSEPLFTSYYFTALGQVPNTSWPQPSHLCKRSHDRGADVIGVGRVKFSW